MTSPKQRKRQFARVAARAVKDALQSTSDILPEVKESSVSDVVHDADVVETAVLESAVDVLDDQVSLVEEIDTPVKAVRGRKPVPQKESEKVQKDKSTSSVTSQKFVSPTSGTVKDSDDES